jgi:hypothetical protein
VDCKTKIGSSAREIPTLASRRWGTPEVSWRPSPSGRQDNDWKFCPKNPHVSFANVGHPGDIVEIESEWERQDNDWKFCPENPHVSFANVGHPVLKLTSPVLCEKSPA